MSGTSPHTPNTRISYSLILASTISLVLLAVASLAASNVQASPQRQTTPTLPPLPTPTFDVQRLAKEEDLQVLSLTCSHLGCMVEPRNFGFECPCHSSRYKPDGRLLHGPATEDLQRLRVEKSQEGNLHVFKS